MYCVRVSVAHFFRDIMRLCWRVLACHACAIVCMYIDIDIVCSACGLYCVGLWRSCAVGSVCCRSAFLLVLLVSCAVVCCYGLIVLQCAVIAFLCSVVVVLPCALSCDCSAFYKCLLCVWLMVGWFARVVSLLVWLVLVCACCSLADGVRMARISFKCIDIYLYTDGVARDCGAFSCSCGGLWCWLVVCLCMNISRLIPCGGVGVLVYICIYVSIYALVAVLVVVWWWFPCVYMDRYI